MKIIDKTISNESNTTQTGVAAKLANTSIIAELLRKHYSDIQKTMVQEYLSNARDAHRELKLKHHLSVSLPTKRNPFFEVRDYGNKMDEVRLFNNFNNYGDSTKRESNLETGGFGLGSKIAYAYTPIFFVIRYTGEEKITYQADCSKNVMGELKKLSSVKSKEKTGFCVKIPIKEVDFEKIKQSFYLTTFFWKNDQEIQIENFDKDEINEDWLNRDYVEEKDFYLTCSPIIKSIGTNYVVLDGIVYPLQSSLMKIPKDNSFNTRILSLKFQTGDLVVAINREQLQVTDENKKKIKDKIEKITNKDVSTVICNSLNKIKKQETKLYWYEYFCKKMAEYSKYQNQLFLDVLTNKLSFKDSAVNKKVLYFRRSSNSWTDDNDSFLNLGLELLEGEQLFEVGLGAVGEGIYQIARVKEIQFLLKDKQSFALMCSDMNKNLLHRDTIQAKFIDLKLNNLYKGNQNPLVLPLFKTDSVERFNKFCNYKSASSLGDVEELIKNSQESYLEFLKKKKKEEAIAREKNEAKAKEKREKEELMKAQSLKFFEDNKDNLIFCKKAHFSSYSAKFEDAKHVQLSKQMIFIPDLKEWKELLIQSTKFSLFGANSIFAIEQKYFDQITDDTLKLSVVSMKHKTFVNKLSSICAQVVKDELNIGKKDSKESQLVVEQVFKLFNVSFDLDGMREDFKKVKKIINNDFLDTTISKRTKGALFLEMENSIIKKYAEQILKV